MGVDGPHWFSLGAILLLTLAGFHGLFFYRNLMGRSLSWGLFQAGIILLLLALAGLNPLAQAMAWTALAVLAGVLLALFTLCRVLFHKYETLEDEELQDEVGG